MRGKKRTKEERHELFDVLCEYLELGFSLKKACALADIPYSSIRDITTVYEPLRASVTAMQNRVNVIARENIVRQIEGGDASASKWWLERMDNMEVIHDPIYGGKTEGMIQLAEDRVGVRACRAETLDDLAKLVELE
jgi:hypothetical protein